MSTALQLAKPFLPKQVSSVLDAQNQLKALEVELEYAKRNFERFEVLVSSIRKFANTWEMRLCSLDEAEYFMGEWQKQLKRFETQADASVFNTAVDVSIRTLNADKFRKRLANFKYEIQSVQLNCLLDISGLALQLNTAALLPDPGPIIAAIRQEYTEACVRTEFSTEKGYLPKDWVAAGQAAKTAATSFLPSAKTGSGQQPKSFLTPELQQSLSKVIG